jgi:hypothetical protein
MPLDQVAELARQAATDTNVLNALRDDPASVRAPLNLSDAQLRALVSAGSFTTARPAVTTSRVEPSQASAVAALEVGTLFPPEGEGQFPTPGELPPIIVAPHAAPPSTPSSSQPPKSVPGRAPGSGHPPAATAPGAGRTPSAGQTPQAPPHTPQGVPSAPRSSAAPQPQHGTPGGFTPAVSQPPRPPGTPVTPQATMPTPSGPGTPNGGSGAPVSNGQSTGSGSPCAGEGQTNAQQMFSEPVSTPQPCGCGCGVYETAIVSIMAEVTAAAQTAIASITATAGLD